MQVSKLSRTMRLVRAVPSSDALWPQLTQIPTDMRGSTSEHCLLQASSGPSRHCIPEDRISAHCGYNGLRTAYLPLQDVLRQAPSFASRASIPFNSKNSYSSYQSFHTSTSHSANKIQEHASVSKTEDSNLRAGDTEATTSLGGWEPDKVINLANGLSFARLLSSPVIAYWIIQVNLRN